MTVEVSQRRMQTVGCGGAQTGAAEHNWLLLFVVPPNFGNRNQPVAIVSNM